MVPITFHCANCGNILGKNRYTVNPFTNRPLKTNAICPDCYENLRREATRQDVEFLSDVEAGRKEPDLPEED